ncbi:MAG TPA: hypothetical protein VMK42_15175 [Anaeromyxobacteraceae bacterium]|nr:hypothetical protein [Anaeromyxobacteraceae bacterium]
MSTSTKRLSIGLALVAAAALVGACPIPQPLPGVGSIDAGLTITPPRVATGSARPALALTAYGPPASCDGGAAFQVSASVIDDNTGEVVDVRWFADYDPTSQAHIAPLSTQTLPAPANSTQVLRTPDPVVFHPSDYDADLPAPRTHVVEMVISNGFEPAPDGGFQPSLDGGMPYREPAQNYEVQEFRWTFEPQADGGCGP